MTYEELRALLAAHPDLDGAGNDAVVEALRLKTVEIDGKPVALLASLGWHNLCGGDIHWARNPTEQPAGATNDEWWRPFGSAERAYDAADKIGERNRGAFEAKVIAGTIEAKIVDGAIVAEPVATAAEALGQVPPR